jgi:hypothetical protein
MAAIVAETADNNEAGFNPGPSLPGGFMSMLSVLAAVRNPRAASDAKLD